MDLAEFQLNKDRWRDEFVGKYIYDKRERQRFLETFVNVKTNKVKEKEVREKEVTKG
ncbi:hypothetical protein [Thermoflexibacter ruber]|uniref:Uncharacterized protein n=1 Tax=Thermoflexibacter ruber TaxID=1003 RepID=A0A1I2JE63_9BACT|nr:hypothetical protein [Thermoflexibacter ruber]SFF51457.1 hypothetical protein SAMN04488541_104528 [Thermoflexibacter ruber]